MIRECKDVESWIPGIRKNEQKVLKNNGYTVEKSAISVDTFKDFIVYEYITTNSKGMISFKYREKDVYVPSFGLYAEGEDVELVIYSLYTYAAKEWVNKGFRKHILDCISIDNYYDTLLNLGFAAEQVYAIKGLNEFVIDARDIVVRKLRGNDEDLLEKMADIIYSFQHVSPVFVPADEKSVNEIRNGYKGLVDDDEVMFYIAEESEPAAFAALWENEEEFLIPPRSVELSIVGTFLEMSSRGIGSRLIKYVVGEQRENYNWITTDWRVTNIKARRFWKDKCGFGVTKTRMIRLLEENYEPYSFE